MSLLTPAYVFLGNGTIVFWSVVTFGLFVAILFPLAGRGFRRPGDPTIIDLQLAFSKRRFVTILQSWISRSGFRAIRALRWSIATLDTIFPIVYAVFGSSTIAWLSVHPGQAPKSPLLILFALPWLAAACDYCENGIHLWLTGSLKSADDLSRLPALPIQLASAASAVKIVLLLISLLALAMLFAIKYQSVLF